MTTDFPAIEDLARRILALEAARAKAAGTQVDDAVQVCEKFSQVVLEKDLGAVLEEIVREVEASVPGFVLVDSFRTIVRKAQGAVSDVGLQGFIQRLALHLTSWQATSFLIGEYVEAEIRDNPVFTVADGLFWLSQQVERNSIVRKLQVVKLRGQDFVPGLHTVRITADGLQTFPRTFGLAGKSSILKGARRLSSGIPKLDELLHGGIPEGDSLLMTGPSGAGKTLFGTQFIADGIKHGQPGIVAIFEELPGQYVTCLLDLCGLGNTRFGRSPGGRHDPSDGRDGDCHLSTTIDGREPSPGRLFDSATRTHSSGREAERVSPGVRSRTSAALRD